MTLQQTRKRDMLPQMEFSRCERLLSNPYLGVIVSCNVILSSIATRDWLIARYKTSCEIFLCENDNMPECCHHFTTYAFLCLSNVNKSSTRKK